MSGSDVEVRIYFEVIEQASHFLQPCMEGACSRLGVVPEEIRLVKMGRPSAAETPVAEAIRGALAMKDPDAVITVVREGIERAVAFFEFSTAVRTEDHDQQRFDAFVAAAEVGAPMIKVYAERVSEFGHGGKTDHDARAIYKIVQQQFGTAAFEHHWPVNSEGTRALTDPRFLSCPEPNEEMTALLTVLTSLALQSPAPIGRTVLGQSEQLPNWAEAEIRANSEPFERPSIPGPKAKRVWVQGDRWNLKFNRWGHAMDPERGMAWYLRAAVGETLVGHIHDSEVTSSESAFKAFLKGTGLKAELFGSELMEDDRVDISERLREAAPNRAGLSIFTNCSEFKVCNGAGDKLLTVEWSAQSIPGLASYGVSAPATQLRAGASFTEDEVTYSVVHDVLLPAGYELVFVSFPGAQGDFAILDPETGRARGRTYIDVIAFHREKQVVALVEAKGGFAKGAVLSAAEKILKWRDDPKMARTLRERLRAIWEPAGAESTPLIVGVAYAKAEVDGRALDLGVDFEISVAPQRWTASSSIPEAIGRGGELSLPMRFSY